MPPEKSAKGTADQPFDGRQRAPDTRFLRGRRCGTAVAHAPGGEVSETLNVSKTDDGYAITAKLIGPVPEGTPEAGPGTDIVLERDKFSYKRTVAMPDGAQLTITYTGVVSGDKFTGMVDMGFAQALYTGVRKK